MSQNPCIEQAKALVPELYARAIEAEEARHIPETSAKALANAGLTRMLQPARWGGLEGDIGHFVDVCAALAHGCVSTAWCNFVWGMHNRLIALYPDQAQQEVWGEDASVLTSAALNPSGTAENDQGGARLAGRWSFASGCDHASWLLLGAMHGEGEQRAPALCLVPRHEVEIVDTWFVAGLRGTGSKDVQVDDLFVPAHRVLGFERSIGPHVGPLTVVIAGPLMGAAEAAVEHFTRRLRERTLVMGQKQSEQAGAKMRLAESSAEVDAGRLLMERACREMQTTRAGEADPGTTVRWLRDIAFAVQLFTRATQRIFEASGGGSLQTHNPIQRIWRDLNAGHSHAYLNWDTMAENYANFTLAQQP